MLDFRQAILGQLAQRQKKVAYLGSSQAVDNVQALLVCLY